MSTETCPRLATDWEAFEVEELPAYPCSGTGEHRYLWIEKRDLTTDMAVKLVARAAGIRPAAVGYAGRKDRQGVTRQWLSLHFGDEPAQAQLDEACAGLGPAARLRILASDRHDNKLRPGHLRGNRFRLRLVDFDPAAAAPALHELTEHGLVNRFGSQRFGRGGGNTAVARALGAEDWRQAASLLVDPGGGWTIGAPLPATLPAGGQSAVWRALQERPDDPRRACRRLGKRLTTLLRNAAQAACFNAVLDARAREERLDRCAAGEVLQHPSGAVFCLGPDEVADAQARITGGELTCTGPLPGRGGVAPAGQAASEEIDWIRGAGFDPDWFTGRGPLASQAQRRPLRVRCLDAPRVEPCGDDHRLIFALPPGAYATEVLAQLGITVER